MGSSITRGGSVGRSVETKNCLLYFSFSLVVLSEGTVLPLVFGWTGLDQAGRSVKRVVGVGRCFGISCSLYGLFVCVLFGFLGFLHFHAASDGDGEDELLRVRSK